MSMGDDVDKSLLDRLKALRGGPTASQSSRAPQYVTPLQSLQDCAAG